MAPLRIFLSLAGILTTASEAARSAGCARDLPAAQTGDGDCVDSFLTDFKQKNGADRTYRIHIPTNYDKNTSTPLIFSFHGRGKKACGQERLSEFSNEAINPNAIAVYPQGLDDQWQGDPDSQDVDDLAFVRDMIEHFEQTYCIDSSRIYAAGKSNGGGFTGYMACDALLSTKIAAFAPVSGAFYVNSTSEADCNETGVPQHIEIPCSPGRGNIPIMEFHGSADETIPYSGGGRRGQCLPTVPHWVREWSKREGYGLTNKTTSLYDGKVLKYEYAAAQGILGIVTHYFIQGLGHAWPSTEANGDNPDGTYLNASPLIMEFFDRYTL